MIKLNRLNGTVILLNENFIEIAEETPDTVVFMQNGHSYLVKETVDEIMEKTAEFRRKCLGDGDPAQKITASCLE